MRGRADCPSSFPPNKLARRLQSLKASGSSFEHARLVTSGAADGFVVSPAFLPDTFEDFVAEVVPILQAKKLFRTEYEAGTLRDRLGLSAEQA